MEVMSWIAAFVLIASYVLLSMGRLKPSDAAYHAMNLVGSGTYVVYSCSMHLPASIFINAFFSLIALYFTIKLIIKKTNR